MMSQPTRRMQLQEQVLRRVSQNAQPTRASLLNQLESQARLSARYLVAFLWLLAHVGAIILRTNVSGKRPRQLRREERPEYLSGVQLFLCRTASRASGGSPV